MHWLSFVTFEIVLNEVQIHKFLVIFLDRLQKNKPGKVRETFWSVSGSNVSVVERRSSQKKWYDYVLRAETFFIFF